MSRKTIRKAPRIGKPHFMSNAEWGRFNQNVAKRIRKRKKLAEEAEEMSKVSEVEEESNDK